MQMLVKEILVLGLCSYNVGNVLPSALKCISPLFRGLNILQLLLVQGNWRIDQAGNWPEWTRMETDLPAPHWLLSLSSPLMVECGLCSTVWHLAHSLPSSHQLILQISEQAWLPQRCLLWNVDWVWFPCYISCEVRMGLPCFKTHVSFPFITVSGALECTRTVWWELILYICSVIYNQLHVQLYHHDNLKTVIGEVWMGKCYKSELTPLPTPHQRASF